MARIPARIVGLVGALLVAGACHGRVAKGAPARIVAGESDTVLVNSRRAVRIPLRVTDAAGRALPDSAARFAWESGAEIPISPGGEVRCVQRGDATVRSTIGALTTRFLLRCRPVEALRFPGPIQLVLGDSAQEIPVTAYGPDNRPVHLFAARTHVGDTTLVALEGMRVRPRAWGATILSVVIGDRQVSTGVHVYAPATTLDGLHRERRLVAVPLRLAPGEWRRWSLPPGGWMLTMWPEEDEGRGLQLRIEGARCGQPLGLSRRRFSCASNGPIAVVVYAPWRAGSEAVLTGTLAVKPDGETLRPKSAPLASSAGTH